MRIDLHCHTKKCKKGDGNKRNVTKDKFIKKICEADVGVVAITNHNCFDKDQYLDFQNEKFLIWPGIELDIYGDESKGHCILIGNPKDVEVFDKKMKQIINGTHPDDFNIEICDLATKIKDLDVIAICHYGRKNPSLSQNDIDKFKNELSEEIPFYCEPRNLISAGIYYAKNINTMIGSDVRDWDNYSSDRVPELKLPIDSFANFKLLIKKDRQIIETFVNKKESRILNITPFENKKESMQLKIFNDINILFGGKGTGKTKILEALEKELLNTYPNEISSYYASGKTQSYNDLIDKQIYDSDFDKLSIDDCSEEIKFFSNWKEINMCTLKDYKDWKVSQKNKKIKFGFINATFIDEISYDTLHQKRNNYKNVKNAIKTIKENDNIKYLNEVELRSLNMLLDKLDYSIYIDEKKEYCKVKSLELEKFTINKMKMLYTNKKGTFTKPSSTGLLDIYNHSSNAKKKAKKIIFNLNVDSYFENKFLGEISDKDFIYVRKEIFIDSKHYTKDCLKILHASKCKEFEKNVKLILDNCFGLNLNSYITQFVGFNKENEITSLRKLYFEKVTTIKTNSRIEMNNSETQIEYTPSSGEQAMLIISHAIEVKKKVYILDEPEMSVGHDYINNKILPRLKELSRNNSIVIIATHDANIAVRSLPFQSIYREKTGAKGITYVGNPFIEEMKDIENEKNVLSWTELSLNTLEGGKIAFNERGETYGEKL